MNDLPNIDDFFVNDNPKHIQPQTADATNKLKIYLSKGDNKWVEVEFLDVAIAGIGIHVLLPVFVELTSVELKNARIKFEKRIGNDYIVLKETEILVRWQEKDLATGKLKLGIHFHGKLKKDQTILNIIEELKK